MTEHKNIESPWTKHSYIIRQLDPTILAIFSKTETQETKNLRQKIQDKLDDIKREENRQKQTGQKDESVLEAMQIELQKYYEQLNQLRPLDEKELENRKKIIQYGLVQPKIKSDDDFLDLGIDMSFVWASIVNFSSVPENYAEIMEALFRRKQSDDNKGGADG